MDGIMWLSPGDDSTNASNVHIYVNGIETSYQLTQNEGEAKPSDDLYDFWIGGQQDNLFPFDGLIDDVRIYNRALSPDEVRRLYLMGK
jgi:hypothetical protein